MFTREDTRWLSATTRELYTARTPSELAHAATRAARERFSVMTSACEELSYDASRYVAHALHTDVTIPPDYAAYIHDHPILPLLSSPSRRTTMRLREVVTQAAWHRTNHFNGVARRAGYNDQMVTLACTATDFLSLGLYRDTLFHAAEQDLLGLLQPHFHAAWCRVRSQAQTHAVVQGRLLRLSPTLSPIGMSPSTFCLLRAYFPHWRKTHALPSALHVWLESCVAALTQIPPQTLRIFRTESAWGRLSLRCFPLASNGEIELQLLEVLSQPDFRSLRALGLTLRECEVLNWIAQGKRDAEIAVILGRAAKTVSKHVEHLLEKLGAETRLAAARTAQEWIRRGES